MIKAHNHANLCNQFKRLEGDPNIGIHQQKAFLCLCTKDPIEEKHLYLCMHFQTSPSPWLALSRLQCTELDFFVHHSIKHGICLLCLLHKVAYNTFAPMSEHKHIKSAFECWIHIKKSEHSVCVFVYA